MVNYRSIILKGAETKKILVIEDEKDTRILLAERLGDFGLTVVVAEDACRAVELAIKERPDLIILDLQLPAGNGLSVLKRLRSNSNTSSVKVVVCTGINDPEFKSQIFEECISGYLEKPYEFDELLSIIKECLSIKLTEATSN